jgi:ring-1,2-phenylacetyl-CoA epoxidase subunit PaaE
MISMLRYIHDCRLSTPVTLLYCVRTSKDIIFETQLEMLRDSCPNFDYWVSISQPDKTWKGHTGHLTREFIVDHVIDLEIPMFFLCGPGGFMENAHQILASLGVEESRIIQESFDGQRAPAEQGPGRTVGTVKFVRSQKTCELPAGSSLLEVAESNRVQIPYGCRQGQCGTCAIRVLCGSVHMSTDAGLTPEQKDAGYVLPCVGRAEGSVVVEA